MSIAPTTQAVEAPWAHSPPAHDADGEGHAYAEHVRAVRSGASHRAETALRYHRGSGLDVEAWVCAISAAAEYHDLGKLLDGNQAVLRSGRGERLPYDHIDAGAAYLLSQGAETAAWLVRAHHAPGLPDDPDERHVGGARPYLRGVRDRTANGAEHQGVITATDESLEALVRLHQDALGGDARAVPPGAPVHGLSLRMALSCLVDADHGDTATFDRGDDMVVPPALRWADRLAHLDASVAALGRASSERDRLRQRYYEACRNTDVGERMATLPGPVGIGKTTALPAAALRMALGANETPRHLIWVAPYTAVITQTVRTLRRMLVLPGESPTHVVAEHHHRVEFEDRSDREMATLWRAPVVVTTAVQFLETLASNRPARLRKLHELAGSTIVIDEAHDAWPPHLWRQADRWLRELTEAWGCRVILASGTLHSPWSLPAVVDTPRSLPPIVPDNVGAQVQEAERARVTIDPACRRTDLRRLASRLDGLPGPRIVVMNTLTGAATVAAHLRQEGHDVEHLSTALAPTDRERIIDRVRGRLARVETDADWTLVGTSLVEVGLDLSFRSGLRELRDTASFLQFLGRIHRQGEGWADAQAALFVLRPGAVPGEGFMRPEGARVLLRMLRSGELAAMDRSEAARTALEQEVVRSGSGPLGRDLVAAEEAARYPVVADRCRVIDDEVERRLVVTDGEVADALERGESVSQASLIRSTIRLRATWAEKHGVPIEGHPEMLRWPAAGYDREFLGCMAGVLA